MTSEKTFILIHDKNFFTIYYVFWFTVWGIPIKREAYSKWRWRNGGIALTGSLDVTFYPKNTELHSPMQVHST